MGRVVLVNNGKYYNKLGVLLSMKTVPGKDTTYRVLVLDHQFKSSEKVNLLLNLFRWTDKYLLSFFYYLLGRFLSRRDVL